MTKLENRSTNSKQVLHDSMCASLEQHFSGHFGSKHWGFINCVCSCHPSIIRLPNNKERPVNQKDLDYIGSYLEKAYRSRHNDLK